ncbi:MAG: hypothetical protein ACRCYP_03395 [Alphaproteobacteria bacterium]
MKVMGNTTFWVDFDEEIHCDECMEVVHFHFDEECPVCHTKHAGTDQYCSVMECFQSTGCFFCQSCDSKFKIIQYQYAADTPKDALIQLL